MKIVTQQLPENLIQQSFDTQKETKKNIRQKDGTYLDKKTPNRIKPEDIVIPKEQDKTIKFQEPFSKINEPSFKEELESASHQQAKKVLEELLVKIDDHGKILMGSPIYENLLVYRELVQTFMRKALRDIYRINTTTSTKKLGSKKVYFIIEKINQNIALLTEEVISSQANPIKLAERLDELKGLLIDLYS